MHKHNNDFKEKTYFHAAPSYKLCRSFIKVHNKTFNFVESKSSLQSFTSGQVKLQVVKRNGDLSHLLARLRPSDGLCSLVIHGHVSFGFECICSFSWHLAVKEQQLAVFADSNTPAATATFVDLPTATIGCDTSAWSSDTLTTAAPVDLSPSPPPSLTLALLASAPLCRPLSLRSYCVLAEALQRLAASFISDLFNHSKSPFSLMSEVVWPEVVFLNRAPAAAARSWSLMCRDARLKQALRTLHVGGEKKVH